MTLVKDNILFQLPTDPAIAVYLNPDEQIVIRQDDPMDTEDACVVLSVERVDMLVRLVLAAKDDVLTRRADKAAARTLGGMVP